MMSGLGRAVSKTFGPKALEIPWIGFGKIRGSKPQMVGTIEVPFWINIVDGFATAGSAKIRGVKPSMEGMVCPFFGVATPESTSDSIMPSIMTKVRGVGGILHKRSRKYSSQSFLDPIVIAL